MAANEKDAILEPIDCQPGSMVNADLSGSAISLQQAVARASSLRRGE
jgi:hypothetical protein